MTGSRLKMGFKKWIISVNQGFLPIAHMFAVVMEMKQKYTDQLLNKQCV